MIKLLITDLDDTLYSWIDFFIPAFYGMLDELSLILNKPKNILVEEYKQIHQEKGSVEYPFATLLLPSVKDTYPNRTKDELLDILNPAFHKFNSIRKHRLKLYPNVKETLKKLSAMEIRIVGYTDSAEENGFYRLKKLEISDYFKRVYVSDSQFERPNSLPSSTKTQIVHGRKPNPELINTICKHENVAINETIYLGDSMTKDIYMARMAGVTSVLCKYPRDTKVEEDLYSKLVAISHWTKSDFQKEITIKEVCTKENIQPDYIIQSFDEFIAIIQSLNNASRLA